MQRVRPAAQRAGVAMRRQLSPAPDMPPRGLWATMGQLRTHAPLFVARAGSVSCLISRAFPSFRSYRFRSVGSSVGSFCSSFELSDRALAERRIAVQIAGVEDRAH